MSAQAKLIAAGASVLLLLALAAAALFGSYQHGVTVTDARWKALWADQQTLQAKGLAAATTANRIEEQRRQTAVNQAGSDAREQTKAATADAAVADAAGQRLHQSADQLASRAGDVSCDTGAAERSRSASRAAMVLSDLFQRADNRAGEMARAYDGARIAGLACERAYRSLRPAAPSS
jgi:hypothetical protein